MLLEIFKKFKLVLLIFASLNFIYLKTFSQNLEFGIRENYRYFIKTKGAGNKFTIKTKYPNEFFSTELYFQKNIFKSFTKFEIKLGGGINILTNSLFFKTKNSNDNKIILLPLILNSYTFSPIKIFNGTLKLRSDISIPLRLNYQNKFNDYQYFSVLNMGYSVIFNSKKYIPFASLGFSSNITPFLVGKDTSMIVNRKYFRNSIFILFHSK